MNTKANKNKISSASNIPDEVDVQSKKQNLLICGGIPQPYSFVSFCKNNTTLHYDKYPLTFSFVTGKQLLIYKFI